jgi:hypothetical protein
MQQGGSPGGKARGKNGGSSIRSLILSPEALILGGFALVLSAGFAGWKAGLVNIPASSPPARTVLVESPPPAPRPEEPLPGPTPSVPETAQTAPSSAAPAQPAPPITSAVPAASPAPVSPTYTPPRRPSSNDEETDSFDFQKAAERAARAESAPLVKDQMNPGVTSTRSMKKSWDGRPEKIFRRSVADTTVVHPAKGGAQKVTIIPDSSRGTSPSSPSWSYSPTTPAGPTLPIWNEGSYIAPPAGSSPPPPGQ